MKITFLGTGTSQGIPVIGCQCMVCQSKDPRDKRLRTSILVSDENTQVVVDTGPDFRQQMLREKVNRLDAVVYTHAHKDHIAGMDDIRAFNFIQKKDMDIYATEAVQEALQREFYYVFTTEKYPGVPSVNLHTIDSTPFKVGSLMITPIEVLHYRLPIKAFRIKDFTYITDAKYIADEELEKIKGTQVLVINALRKQPHISHFNLTEALDMIARIQPKKAYLTHLSHLMGKSSEIGPLLPENVHLATDGLTLTL